MRGTDRWKYNDVLCRSGQRHRAAFRESKSLPRGQKRKSCSEALASGEVSKARVTSVTRDWREDMLTKLGGNPTPDKRAWTWERHGRPESKRAARGLTARPHAVFLSTRESAVLMGSAALASGSRTTARRPLLPAVEIIWCWCNAKSLLPRAAKPTGP